VLPSASALALFERVLGIHTLLARTVHQIAAEIAVEPAPIDVEAHIAYLNDRLFADARHRGDGIYEIAPELVCPSVAPGGGGSGVDPACAAAIDQLAPRIRTAVMPTTLLTDTSAGVVFALQLGPAGDEPLTIELLHHELAPSLVSTELRAELDLDQLQRALDGLSGAAAAYVPRTALSGHVRARLQGDPSGASFDLWIDRQLSMRIAGPGGALDGADALALSSAADSQLPVLSIVLAPRSPQGVLDVRLGATAVELPTRGKRLGLDLAGLTASTVMDRFLPLEVVDIGFGGRPVVVTVDGARAQTLDVNPDDGHDFNVIVQRDEAVRSLQTLQVHPRLDLRMTVDHAVFGDAAPLYDTTRVVLDGVVRTTSAPDRLEVTDGTYRLETDPVGHGFEATAGQCVTGVDSTDPGPLVVRWSVGACN